MHLPCPRFAPIAWDTGPAVLGRDGPLGQKGTPSGAALHDLVALHSPPAFCSARAHMEAWRVLRGHESGPQGPTVRRRGDRAPGDIRSPAAADRLATSRRRVLAQTRPARKGRRDRAGGGLHRAERAGAQGVGPPAEGVREASASLSSRDAAADRGYLLRMVQVTSREARRNGVLGLRFRPTGRLPRSAESASEVPRILRLTRRKSRGAMPVHRRKARVKWAWSEYPRSSAMSRTVASVPSRSRTAVAKRDSATKRPWLTPASANRRCNARTLMPIAFAVRPMRG